MKVSASSGVRHNYDILLVGAGMVGSALALALAQEQGRPLKIGLLDAGEPNREPPVGEAESYDVRVSAITQGSRRLLEALGAWPTIARQRSSPFRHIYVWDAGSAGRIHFDSTEIGQDHLGYIIENRVILAALWSSLEKFGNIEWLTSLTLETLDLSDGRITVRTSDGQTLTSQVIVGADGAHSQVRELAGIATSGWPYAQQGIVATVETELYHHETAWQRFLQTGPLAFLPLQGNYCSVVWTTGTEQAEALLAAPEADFEAELEFAFEAKLGGVRLVGPRASFPLKLQHAQQYVCPGVALVGDAAHVIHPLAGQGVNLGFLDAAALSQVLLEAHRKSRRLGSYRTLRGYERWRRGENLLMIAATDGLQKLFGLSFWPLRWSRGLGLRFTDASGPVKRAIIRHAMGVSGDLPAAMRFRPEGAP